MSDDRKPYFESLPPAAPKSYLGDGLYACFDGNYLWLEAYDGIAVSNRVGLEDTVMHALVRFAARCFHESVVRP